MHRAGLRLGALLWTLIPCARALGHGEAPAAYAVISHDTEGPRALRLSAGVALRRGPQRFQFVCPAAWGDQFAAPLAALADGTLVVGTPRGLMLLSEDGTVRPHPDPVAAGRTSEVVRTPHGVFSLRAAQEGGSEVLAVDAQKVRVLWKDGKSLYSMAALDDKLVLLRGVGGTLEQVTIATADGAELERQVAVVDMPVDYVFARGTAGAAYALVAFPGTFVLGTLHMNTFTKLAEGLLSVAGPLRSGDGTLLAPDGKLSQLVEGATSPLADDHYVLCLEQSEGLAYACDRNGIARVNGQALGESIFHLSWLVPPDLERVMEGEPRMRCSAQWQDLRFDLLTAGTSLLVDMPGAGSAPAGEGGVAAQLPDAALGEGGINAGDADGGQAPAAVQPRKEGGAGCATLPGTRGPGTTYMAVSALLLAVLLARGTARFELVRARRRARSSLWKRTSRLLFSSLRGRERAIGYAPSQGTEVRLRTIRKPIGDL